MTARNTSLPPPPLPPATSRLREPQLRLNDLITCEREGVGDHNIFPAVQMCTRCRCARGSRLAWTVPRFVSSSDTGTKCSVPLSLSGTMDGVLYALLQLKGTCSFGESRAPAPLPLTPRPLPPIWTHRPPCDAAIQTTCV